MKKITHIILTLTLGACLALHATPGKETPKPAPLAAVVMDNSATTKNNQTHAKNRYAQNIDGFEICCMSIVPLFTGIFLWLSPTHAKNS
ncbi:hypothetical protein CVU75_03610 [Candidatus Dependentiae bacterium HGW-Dependentiae-1]|nr:MAG: hypothetical protein CVU75_03610 [Candidatus Dependentiae bacterium HGW-Dependentiae-1]